MPKVDKDNPVFIEIEYPDRELDRVTTFFRLFMIIPPLIILSLLANSSVLWNRGPWTWQWPGLPGYVVSATVLLILFAEKYPKWWFNWNLNLARFTTRIGAYFALLTDEFPSTDEDQAVDLQLHYPDVKEELHRAMPLIKWFLAIPHYVLLFFLNIVALMLVIIAWFSILFTGRYPKALFDFVVGVFRWNLRVLAYAILLITDEYPPFSLE